MHKSRNNNTDWAVFKLQQMQSSSQNLVNIIYNPIVLLNEIEFS